LFAERVCARRSPITESLARTEIVGASGLAQGVGFEHEVPFCLYAMSASISIGFACYGATPIAIVSATRSSIFAVDFRLLGLRLPASSRAITVWLTHIERTGCPPCARAALTQFGHKAKASAKWVYDFLSDKLGTPHAAPAKVEPKLLADHDSLQNTLTPADAAPPWRGQVGAKR